MYLSKHKQLFVSLVGVGVIFLTGCTLRVVNPDFRECAAKCTMSQTDCMTNATTTGEIRLCKIKQTDCITTCEGAFPRYIE